MINRCTDTDNQAYESYGGRGIRVCERWLTFENFFADMGMPARGMTLDRRDNDGNYEPSNCRWASKQDQANNRRSNKFIEFRGKNQTQAQWERELGLRRGQIYDRLARGWSVESALALPRRPDERPLKLNRIVPAASDLSTA